MRLRKHHAITRAGRASVVGRTGLAALCAMLLSACAEMRRMDLHYDAVAVGLGDPELRHPIGFAPRTESLEVEVPAGAEGLSPNQQIDVYRFLQRYKHEAVGRLVLTTPSSGGDKAAFARSLREIQRQVSEAGIDYRLRHDGPHDARSAGTPAIKLAYKGPVAVPPPCGDWTRDVARNDDRVPYPNWGCATQHNLAVMVDNGRDLGQPQAEDPRSSERRSAAWSAYQDAGAARDIVSGPTSTRR
jgi:pilus assembly protein CpaD